MLLFVKARSFLRNLFLSRRVEADLDQEVHSYLETLIEENIRAGMSPKEAQRAARIELGGIEQVKEQVREERMGNWLRSVLSDCRYGIRQLRKNRAFTAVAVLTLALGIGANTALFSVVNGVLLNPLPYPNAEQLVTLHESKPNFPNGSISYPNFRDWQKQNGTFSAMAIGRGYDFILTGAGEAERIRGRFISSDLFTLLGVNPAIGRTFTPGEDEIGAAPVAIISAGLWNRKFGSSPGILGKPIRLDGKNYTVVGVIPEGFDLLMRGFRVGDVYVPVGQWSNTALTNRAAGLGFHGIGRLKQGMTIGQARADMENVSRNLAAAYPEADKGIGASLFPIRDDMLGDVRPTLLVLLGAVGFVLLIACVNVANLLLARSTRREREIAVRAALGAGQGRLLRQLLTESLLLAVVGGALGLLLASWGTQAALRSVPFALPRAAEVGLDARVLLFTVCATLLAGALFGVVPALKTRRVDIHETLKEGGRGGGGTRHGTQRVLVVLETALALFLLTGAGLMVRSLALLWQTDPGFNPHNAMVFDVSLAPSMQKASPEAIRATLRELVTRLESVPGVGAASLTWAAMPMVADDEDLFWMEGQPKPASENDMNWALSYVVQENYLKVMGIPLEHGRFFTPYDNENSPRVIVIDDVFARKFFPDQDPIGKRVNLNTKGGLAEIVGVVGHVKQWGLDRDDTQSLRAQLYFPYMQLPNDLMALVGGGTSGVVRFAENSPEIAAAMRRAVSAMNGEQVLYGATTMEEIIAQSLAARRFSMILLGTFAAFALLLASVGIYGVVSCLVEQRTHEIGIRVALGAQPEDVLRMVLREGAKMTAAGIGAGLIVSTALTRLMASLLFGVSATDPLTFVGVAIMLAGIALAACYVPARRAMRVDPLVALRYE